MRLTNGVDPVDPAVDHVRETQVFLCGQGQGCACVAARDVLNHPTLVCVAQNAITNVFVVAFVAAVPAVENADLGVYSLRFDANGAPATEGVVRLTSIDGVQLVYTAAMPSLAFLDNEDVVAVVYQAIAAFDGVLSYIHAIQVWIEGYIDKRRFLWQCVDGSRLLPTLPSSVHNSDLLFSPDHVTKGGRNVGTTSWTGDRAKCRVSLLGNFRREAHRPGAAPCCSVCCHCRTRSWSVFCFLDGPGKW